MPRIEPITREELAEFEPMFKMVEAVMGFVPRSMLTMGRNPALLRGFLGLSATVLQGGKIDAGLSALISYVASNASGCRYCQAHTSHTAYKRGVTEEKIKAAFEYDTSPLFSAAEKAALRLAHHAALVPNATTDEDFQELGKHFSADEIVEIVAIISLFGFLNRWNDTMGTQLEGEPRSFAEQWLVDKGWEVAHHA